MSRLKKTVIVREVWDANLLEEFALVRQVLADYPIASMDTEFPGTILRPNVEIFDYSHQLPPSDNYLLMKANVDNLNLIQVGLALSDADGNLPDFGTEYSYVWEFNFRDFDVDFDPQNIDSITLLKQQGIDFEKNREEGIDSEDFATLLVSSGLVFSWPSITWVTFHGAYDFGFLIKILTQRELPEDLATFMAMVNCYFGGAVYDVKHMIKYCDGLYGGLERVAKALDVDRVAGKSHQAGSDSLLTMQTFLKLRDIYFSGQREEELVGFSSVLHGLEHGIEVDLFHQICNVLAKGMKIEHF